jgi:DNA-binding MarR family transcriptional regulator
LGSKHYRWVASKLNNSTHGSVGAWAKRYYFASRTVIEAVLRPYDLGATQWYVLYQLAHEGPTAQRELQRILQIDRATMSTIVATLVRKGLVEQKPDRLDQRQRVLHITTEGSDLWGKLPDPIAVVHAVAFDGVDDAELTRVAGLLEAATQRLNNHGLTE